MEESIIKIIIKRILFPVAVVCIIVYLLTYHEINPQIVETDYIVTLDVMGGGCTSVDFDESDCLEVEVELDRGRIYAYLVEDNDVVKLHMDGSVTINQGRESDIIWEKIYEESVTEKIPIEKRSDRCYIRRENNLPSDIRAARMCKNSDMKNVS